MEENKMTEKEDRRQDTHVRMEIPGETSTEEDMVIAHQV